MAESDDDLDSGWTARNCFRKTVAFLFSHIGLTALVVGYSVMGAFLFRHLEYQHEITKMGVIREWKADTVAAIWNITADSQLKELYQNNCTTSCTTQRNETQVKIQQRVDEQHRLLLQSAKDDLVSSLWNLTMDLNVLWKDNWTNSAEKDIETLLGKIKAWTDESSSFNRKPEIKCTTLCMASSDIKDQTKMNWTSLVTDRIETFQTNISEAAQQGFETGSLTHPKWTFSSSFLYALSVITTIGYGHVTPKTPEGKVVTVLYAVVGIPIMLMFLANVGNLLAKVFIGIFAYVCRCRLLNSPEDPVLVRHRNLTMTKSRPVTTTKAQRFFPPEEQTIPNDEPTVIVQESWEPEVEELVRRLEKRDNNVPVIGCLVIMSAYLLGGATLFSLWEEWPFLDAFYFCFVTLTTIGFGDFVPGASMLSADTSNQKLIMCCIYVLVGLALIACCFNLMQHQVRSYVKTLAKVVGIIKAKARTVGERPRRSTSRRIPTVKIDDV